MADIITYLESEPKPNPKPKPSDNKKSESNCNVYPFMVTDKTCQIFKNGCEKKISEPSCDDCCWICFPFSLTIDIITLLPFLTIYTCKKSLNKCKSL